MTSLKSEYTTTHPVFHTQLEAGRHVVVLKNLEDKKGLGVDQVRKLNTPMAVERQALTVSI